MHRRYTVFMLLRATPAWLALGRGERLAFHDETLQLVFEGFPAVTLRYYDTEAFHGRCSGVAVTLFQIPCKSGWPHGVRGGSHRAALGFGGRACPNAAAGSMAKAISNAARCRPRMALLPRM